MNYKGTVYRVYTIELDFTDQDAPGMIDENGKIEYLSRNIPIEQWNLTDVSVDVFERKQ